MKMNIFKVSLLCVLLMTFASCKQEEAETADATYTGQMRVLTATAFKTVSGETVTFDPGQESASVYLTKQQTLVLVYGQKRAEIKATASMLPAEDGSISASAADLGQSFSLQGSKTNKVEEGATENISQRKCNISIGKKTEWVKEDPSCFMNCKQTAREIEMFREGTCFTETLVDKVTTTLSFKLNGSKSSSAATVVEFTGEFQFSKNRRKQNSKY